MEWYWILLIVLAAINWGALPLILIYPILGTWVWRDFKYEGRHRGIIFKFRLLGGNRVWWNDPDESHSSGEYEIVRKVGELYILKNKAGSVSEVPEDSGELDFMEPWHAKWWKDWGGFAGGLFMCYRDRPTEADDKWVLRTIKHEGTHCWQWIIFGVLGFLLIYITNVAVLILLQVHIWWAIRKTQKLMEEMEAEGAQYEGEWPAYKWHAYLDTFFERWARKAAGQPVKIDPEDWPQGPRDILPWW